ncbi:MAG TPA: GNAT family protein [Polyangia bacterium]|nr:GNAT family protein [Polyangia bacterium]
MSPRFIRTERLILRPWALADVASVFAYAVDHEWARFLPVPHPYSEADAHQFVATQMSLDWQEQFGWAMEHDGRAIGGINLRFFSEGLIAEIDYAVARTYWRRGLATEAAVAVVDTAFQSFPKLTRVRSMVDARNLASARVLEKIGMKREGVLRSNSFERGEAIDEAWYGLLRREWEDQRQSRR